MVFIRLRISPGFLTGERFFAEQFAAVFWEQLGVLFSF
jgi:hypothetical protein